MAAPAWAAGAGGGGERGSAEPDNEQGGEGPEAEVRGSEPRLQQGGPCREQAGLGAWSSTGNHPHRPCTPKSAAQGEQGYDAASQAPTVPAQRCSCPGSGQSLVLASTRPHPHGLWTWKGPSLLPPNAAYKSQQASGRGTPSQGHPTRGAGPDPSAPPRLPRRWREAVGRAGERTLTETLFSHPKNSSWPFPQLPGLANALPLDEKPKAATFRQRGCVCRGRLTQPK